MTEAPDSFAKCVGICWPPNPSSGRDYFAPLEMYPLWIMSLLANGLAGDQGPFDRLERGDTEGFLDVTGSFLSELRHLDRGLKPYFADAIWRALLERQSSNFWRKMTELQTATVG